ncbi:hypothetical protein CLV48_101241 [Cecembia rubra]|uniref:Uncharacterized protein n=2 Tax=Cecembia rubra TaxID=1485585 RepID=A0A2P8ECX2_9BACT|nr:hypothetical protein CLV48_101241 [Cecembia rubra]
MEKLNKKEIHLVPEGYFDKLPDRILERYESRKSVWFSKPLKYAAAAVFILGLGLWVFISQTSQVDPMDLMISQEIDLYIDTEYWQAEDILLLADNPNSILDEIIATEWGSFDWAETDPEEDIWY